MTTLKYSKHLSAIWVLFLVPLVTQAQNGLFIANKGQWHEHAKFRMELPQGFVFFEDQAITYKLYHPDYFGEKHAHQDPSAVVKAVAASPPREVDGHVLRAKFIGAARHTPAGKRAVATKFNFFQSNDPAKWQGDVAAYQSVRYTSLYEGVDLQFYLQYGALKYDFIVQPNADPSNIVFEYEGSEDIALVNNRLRVYTSFNYLEEQKPISYQLIEGTRKEVPTQFVLQDGKVSFHFPDGYNTAYPLVIDPEIVFSTYSGSTQDNWGFTATYDDEGNTYTAGITRADGQFPTTPGAFQETPGPVANPGIPPAPTDIAIQKFSPDGTELLYATYLGGERSDVPHSLIVNSSGQLIVMGTTSSPDFPVTDIAYDRDFNGGTSPLLPDGTDLLNYMGFGYDFGSDIFITAFGVNGNVLSGSTFLGGSNNDGLELSGLDVLTRNYGDFFRGNLALDDSDNIYVTGVTRSDDFPTTSGAFQRNLRGDQDAIICSFNQNLTEMRWSSYFGGSGQEGSFTLERMTNGNWVFGGGTNSTDLPIAGTPIHPQSNGEVDGYVGIISADGRRLVASTYLGTNAYDQVYLLGLDPNDNIVTFGQTLGNYPVSSNDLYSNPHSSQFLHKLSADLSTTIFSTVFGSEGELGVMTTNIRPTAFSVSECGSIYLAGWGGSVNSSFIGGNTLNMPVKVAEAPIVAKTETDGSDFYLMQLAADATQLIYAVYLGGDNEANADHTDGGTSRFDKRGNIYHSACVCAANNFPSTPGVFSETNQSGGCNNLAFKYQLDAINAQVNPKAPSEETGELVETTVGCPPLQLFFTSEEIAGDSLVWDFGDGTTLIQDSPGTITHTFTQSGSFEVTLTSYDQASCEQAVTDTRIIDVLPATFSITPDTTICQGEDIQLLATGGISYEWDDPSTTLSDTGIPNPIASITQTSGTNTYQVFIENEFGCRDTLSTSISVLQGFVEMDSQWVEYCIELPDILLSASAPANIDLSWSLNGEDFDPGSADPFLFSSGEVGEFNFIALYESEAGCVFSDTILVDILVDSVGQAFLFAEYSDPSTICAGDTIPLFVDEGLAYEWSPDATLSANDQATVQAYPMEDTDYTVRILGGKEGCFIDRTIPITVAPAITASIDYDFEYECGELVKVIINSEIAGADSYRWSWGGNDFSTEENPAFYQPTESGNHTLTLQASNFGCLSTFNADLNIPEAVRPPNVITPNNDRKNDTFVVAGLEGWRLQIFDRWGTAVFETDNYQNDWAGDGGSSNTYYYVITAPDGTRCRGVIHVLGQ